MCALASRPPARPAAAGHAARPFAEFGDAVAHDFPLARHTWFRVGGPARYFVRPADATQLGAIARRCTEEGVRAYVLGLGANLLVRDEGVPGAVFRLSEEPFREVRVEGDGDRLMVKVGAGADVQKLVLRACRDGWAGLECMAGIPGTVGGVTRMNAGGRFGDWGANVREVEVMDASGNNFTRYRDDLLFEYRRTNIVAPFILSTTLELTRDDPQAVARRTKEIWMYKRNSQPLSGKSAGCMFKNPRGLSAGSLIDRAGLKGLRVGKATVSDMHANFIVADEDCPAADVLSLVEQVKSVVYDKHGVMLEQEVKVWPE